MEIHFILFFQRVVPAARKLYIQCGNGWEFLNHKGTNSTFEIPNAEWGHFDGFDGLDKQYVDYVYTSGATSVTISTNSTPTAYPLQIRTFRAQAPQDTDFAVIQFTQTINEKIEPFGAFNFHVGDGIEATPGTSVSVNYKGTLDDGKEFDSSYGSCLLYTSPSPRDQA